MRTAGGTALFVAFLWLVRIDDYRVAGMMLTFPMLNGIGLVAAGANAERLTKAMLPVITLNGAMCFLFALALTWWETARAHPAALTVLAAMLWLGVYIVLETRNVAVPAGAATAVFVSVCAVASVAITYWLWPACAVAPATAPGRAGGLAGVLESWVRILLFALSLTIVFGFAHRYQHAHAAVGRLAALPIVPLFGLYTVATVLAPDPAALGKLETMRSMVLVGWTFALVCGRDLPLRDAVRPRTIGYFQSPGRTHRRLGALPRLHRGIGQDRGRAFGLRRRVASGLSQRCPHISAYSRMRAVRVRFQRTSPVPLGVWVPAFAGMTLMLVMRSN